MRVMQGSSGLTKGSESLGMVGGYGWDLCTLVVAAILTKTLAYEPS